MYDDTVSVACKVCGEKAEVSKAAVRNAALLDRQMPIGWAVASRPDPKTGEVSVWCPNHRPDDTQRS